MTDGYLNMNVRFIRRFICFIHEQARIVREKARQAAEHLVHDTSLNRYQTDEKDNDDRLWQERHVGTH